MKIHFFGEVRAIPGEIGIAEDFLTAELTVCNLETPITDSETPITKTGVLLKGTREDFLRFTEVFRGKNRELVLMLANNHLGDYGAKGIRDTLSACEKAGIKCGGISEGNRQEPVIVETPEGSVAIFCVAERQFGVSRDGVLGVDTISPGLYSKIRKAKNAGHFVVLSVHAAAEMNLWPAPAWQETLRSFIDAGVDVVHGHHSRVPQGYEAYGDGVIFYGLGNFLGPVARWRRKRNALWGLAAEVEIRDGKIAGHRVIPLSLREENEKTLAEKIEESSPAFSEVQAYLRDAVRPLSAPRLLEGLWQEFSLKMFENWLAPMMGLDGVKVIDTGRLSRVRNAVYALLGRYEKFIPAFKKTFTQKDYALPYHLFSCETHRLTAETALGLLCGEIPDTRTEETRRLVEKYFQMF